MGSHSRKTNGVFNKALTICGTVDDLSSCPVSVLLQSWAPGTQPDQTNTRSVSVGPFKCSQLLNTKLERSPLPYENLNSLGPLNLNG